MSGLKIEAIPVNLASFSFSTHPFMQNHETIYEIIVEIQGLRETQRLSFNK
jgi:hypothetical protein